MSVLNESKSREVFRNINIRTRRYRNDSEKKNFFRKFFDIRKKLLKENYVRK